MDSHKSVQQLILERDQAMADLNSVERSLSDLFRRYENMKKVLEGFKKVSGTKQTLGHNLLGASKESHGNSRTS